MCCIVTCKKCINTPYNYEYTVIAKFFRNNGKIEGLYESFYQNQNKNMCETCFYINSKKEGIYKKYYYDGHIMEISNYNNDKLNGKVE